MLMELYAEGMLPHVRSIEVEPNYGYTTRINYVDGSVRLTYGNDVGLNPSAASDVAKDKDHTKFFLRRRGFSVPAGSAFVLPQWAERIRPRLEARGFESIRVASETTHYVEAELGYPVYIKAVDGSKGGGIWRCHDEREIAQALNVLDAERVRVAVVEEAVDLPDYRLVVLDGDVISAYRRRPAAVVGDGRATVRELLRRLQADFDRTGRDTLLPLDDHRILSRLRRQALSWESVPGRGQEVVLFDLSNLSLGGRADDVTSAVAGQWRTLSIDIADSLHLRFCGVDLACADIEADGAAYAVLEVNAAPGLDHYAEVGREQLRRVREMYARVLDAPPMASG